MSRATREQVTQFYAQTYDATVPDWPGEIDFYRQLAAEAQAKGGAVLEVACGTGRVAIRLAQDGVNVVGLDLSAEMLAVAREKSLAIPNVRWLEADMRSFDLGTTFALAIIPGHSFQNLLTAEDMEHLLARSGFTVEAVYGDFVRQALRDESAEMVWFARTSAAP